MNPQITRLKNEQAALYGNVTAHFDKLDAEGADGEPRKATEAEAAEVISWNQKAEALEVQIQELEVSEGIRTQAQQRLKELNAPVNPHQFSQRTVTDDPPAVKRLGDVVLEDPQFKAWLDTVAPAGQSPMEGAKLGFSPAVRTKSLVTGLSSTSGGAFVVTDRQPIVDQGTSMRELTLMDLITVSETSSDVVDYVRMGAHTNAAAPVAEATATGDGSGAKPESNLVTEVVSETVKNIAHWLAITRRALSDAPMLRDYVETWLRYGLREEMEDQMITGSGTGENFTGVLNISGTTAQAFSNDLLETTRKARTKVKLTGRARANGYVFHPNNWETIDLLQDNEARYYFGGPSVLGTPRLWGLPVVECEGMTQGTAMVADWRLAYLWLRDQARILVSDSHADFFVRNILAILAEERAAFGVLRPAAFVEIALS